MGVAMVMQAKKEEEAIVLDFLQHGYASDPRPIHLKTPIVHALGTAKFTLLELVPKKDVHLQPLKRVYIGDQKRDDIHHVNGRILYEKLTQTAKSELPHVIKQIVDEDPARFVEFFSKAQPLSIRTHTLELLPGIGKKHMTEILEARREKEFESFADVKARVKLITDPERLVINRILNEIMGMEKHYLFALPPPSEEELDERSRRGPRPPQRRF